MPLLLVVDSNSDSAKSDERARKKLANYKEKITLFVGKYVANKLGQWILNHGSWDAFVDYFPGQGEFEEKMWKDLDLDFRFIELIYPLRAAAATRAVLMTGIK